MKLVTPEPKINIGVDGFEGFDLLGRAPVGRNLTDLVDRIDDPIVIALDGSWGSGKSFFLKMWAGAHKKELSGKADIIYFDAFEHDYLDDPLVSLVTAIAASPALKRTAVDRIKKAALPIARIGLRLGAAAASAGISEIVGAVGDAMAEEGKEASKQAIDGFWKKEASKISAMQEFRAALTKLTAPKGETPTQKLVLIIDELDRCRPDYALSLLEIAKHFFAVPGVHFVLGANLTSLQSSVRARYGACIEAEKYLQKFVHLRMTFPEDGDRGSNGGVAYGYCRIVGAQLGLLPKLLSEILAHVKALTKTREISLRDIQRLCTSAVLVGDCEGLTPGYLSLMVFSIVFNILGPETYARLRAGILVPEDVAKFYGYSLMSNENADYLMLWTRDFWRLALASEIDETMAEEFREYLRDCRFDDRRAHIETFIARRMDTFRFPAELA